MSSKRSLVDADHRAAAVARRDGTVFVEAGAGSGKTTVLVARVLALVADGLAMSSIVAITFTERAGAELRERLRHALDDRLASAVDPDERTRWAGALDELDRAAIGTIHAFAQRVLSGHALAAGLPARFEVVDEASSALAFEQRWRHLAAALFAAPGGDADPASDPDAGSGAADLAAAVSVVLASGVKPAHVRQLAKEFDDAWDLAATRRPDRKPLEPLRLGGTVDELRALAALADRCLSSDDRLAVHLRRLATLADDLADTTDDAARVALLVDPKIANRSGGRKTNWERAGGKDAVLQRLNATAEQVDTIVTRHRQRALVHVSFAVATTVVADARARFAAGRLEFHDLLVGARDVLRYVTGAAEIRAALHDQYRAVLVDEFQDTDPLQLEIVELITADPFGSATAEIVAPGDAAVPRPGPGQRPERGPGRLFLVGDPKQSIYRFRRADLALYLRTRNELGPPLALTSNFRSTPRVVAWINTVFASLVREKPGSQAAYERLDAARTDAPAGPAVVTFGGAHPEPLTANELRQHEAADVAALIGDAIAQGWQVGAGPGTPVEGGAATRPIRWADIAILLPSRTALAEIEEALGARGIPLRIESGTLLWSAPEVAELLAVLHAACDPTDPMKVVTALRTNLLGCSDADLYRHRVLRHRSFTVGAPADGADGPAVRGDPSDDPVASALAAIASWSELASWAAPPTVVARVLDDTRAEALAALTARPREPLRRLRIAQEQARVFADATGGTVSAWLAWIDRQRVDGTRVAEPLLPETDDDAVRVLTIHAAKGLEFPMVVVAGLTTRPGGRPRSLRLLWPADGGPPETRFGPHLASAGYDDAAEIESLLDSDERIRLLYVACTRARDHLGVSLHHVPRGRSSESEDDDLGNADEADGNDKLTLAALLARAARNANRFADELGPPALALAPPVRPQPVAPEALVWAPLPAVPTTTVSATTLAGHHTGAHDAGAHDADGHDADGHEAGGPGEMRDPAETPDPARRKAATTLGIAVHWVLEHVDLVAPADLERLAVAALATTVTGSADTVPVTVPVEPALVAELARVTLAAPIVALAGSQEHWRELYVAVPGAHRQLEGYIDLVVRRPDGLVVVDFKTDAVVPSGAEPAPAHRLQLAAYAHALAAATGEAVVAAVAVYCRDAARPERYVTDLPAAIAEVVALLDRPA